MSQKRARGSESAEADLTVATDTDRVGEMDAAFFESLAAESPDAILSVGPEGRVRYANESVERVLGYDRDTLHGRSVATVVPDRFREYLADVAATYLETGEQRLNSDGAELLAETADGEELPVSVSLVEHEGSGERLFSFVVREITAQVERQEDLTAEAEAAETLATEAAREVQASLGAAQATLSTLAEEYDDARFEELASQHERIATVAEETLVETGAANTVTATERVAPTDLAMEAWGTAETGGADLRVAGSPEPVEAEPDQLRTLLTELLEGGATATDGAVRLTGAEGGEGFGVETDGADELPVTPAVRHTVEAHGWCLDHTADGVEILTEE
jgi:PAS domain S-box-containing protein